MSENSFNFEKLQVYQRALSLSSKIYTITKTWPREHLFGLTDQLRRATLSISLNIAEGSSRTSKDFSHFVSIARGSAFESIPLLQTALGLKLLTESDYELLYTEFRSISQMLTNLRKALMNNKSSK